MSLAAIPTVRAECPGLIVFHRRDISGTTTNDEIYSMRPDGSRVTNLTQNASSDAIPRVSYEGDKVAYMSDRGHPGNYDVWIMNSDGSNPTNITQQNLPGTTLYSAVLSPDNSKVLYLGPGTAGYNIWVANADGSNATNITQAAGTSDNFGYWSYDGTKIVFGSFRDNNGGEEVYIMNSNGTAQTRLTFTPGRDFYPVINPQGTKIAFNSERDGHRQIYVMDVDGANQTNISGNAFSDNTPYYNPEGDKISFISNRDGNLEIYIMNADGSGQTRITTNSVTDAYPGWGECPPPKTFAQFQDNHFDATQLADANISGLTADPDGDGANNLLEYALYLDPFESDATEHLPVIVQTNGYLALTYTRPLSPTDLVYAVEVSSNLVSWTNGPAFVSQSLLSSNYEEQVFQARDLVPLNAAPRRFMRLHISKP